MPQLSAWTPLWMFVIGLFWFGILAFIPHRTGLSARAGGVTAYGEVRNPFPMSDRDPRITIEFDKSPAPMGEDKGFRNQQILFLCNDGGIDAFKVQVVEIRLTSGWARFDEIPQIRPKHREAVNVVEAETRERTDALDRSPSEAKCVITYRDHADKQFITHATISHDIMKGSTSVKDYKFAELKLAKDSRFQLFNWWKP